MRLATLHDSLHADGRLMLVSRDLHQAVPTARITPTLLDALQRWPEVEGPLHALARALEDGDAEEAEPFRSWDCRAPLPAAPLWCESMAFLAHPRLAQQAYSTEPIPQLDTVPVMARGASDEFLGPFDDVQLPEESHGIDFEGGFAVAVDEVPVGCDPLQALHHVKLLLQYNAWSLRALALHEVNTGHGLLQARPATSFAPLAVTPDELGSCWHNGRTHLALHVAWNGQRFGKPHGGEMHFSFGELIAHAARTRRLAAGTLVGAGPVSNAARGAGSACIAERRLVEMVDRGAARTGFMLFGDRVRMVARDPSVGAPFGAIDQRVVHVRAPLAQLRQGSQATSVPLVQRVPGGR
jgi:fumarylacetoacetate (FAA) hydrolase